MDYYTLLSKLITNNVEDITQLLKDYNSNDWNEIVKNVKIDDCNCNKYHKLLVLSNDIVDVFLIVWFAGAKSPIHDHPNGGCVVKILQGMLIEKVYQNIKNKQAILLKSNVLNKNDINFKSGNNILHKIKTSELTISIHVYFPSKYKHTIYNAITY